MCILCCTKPWTNTPETSSWYTTLERSYRFEQANRDFITLLYLLHLRIRIANVLEKYYNNVPRIQYSPTKRWEWTADRYLHGTCILYNIQSRGILIYFSEEWSWYPLLNSDVQFTAGDAKFEPCVGGVGWGAVGHRLTNSNAWTLSSTG